MAEFIFLVLAWIGDHSEYPVPEIQPNVVITEPHNLCAQYGVANVAECRGLQLAGFYDEAQTIFLRSDFDLDDPAHQAWLVHELVHYVQWEAGEHLEACRGVLEVEAYELQDAWRERQGLAASSDAFTLMMLEAGCTA
jgi:hypothetical protein